MTVTGTVSADPERIAAFCRRHRIRRLALFGSRLRGTAGPDSDLDLLVEFEPGHEPGLIGLATLEIELSALFGGCRVDLRTPGDLHRRFRETVRREATTLYAA